MQIKATKELELTPPRIAIINTLERALGYSSVVEHVCNTCEAVEPLHLD